MDAPGRVDVEQLRAQDAGFGILAARDLIALGGRAYVDAVTAVRPDPGKITCACRAAASGPMAATLLEVAGAGAPGAHKPSRAHPSGMCGQVSRC